MTSNASAGALAAVTVLLHGDVDLADDLLTGHRDDAEAAIRELAGGCVALAECAASITEASGLLSGSRRATASAGHGSG